MFGQLVSGAAAGSGGYTATWVLLSHSGTFEDQTGKTHTTTGSGTLDDETHLPLLRSAAADAKPPGNWKCYHPPGFELSSVLSSVISKGSTVTNFGMTLTVAHDIACNVGDKKDMFRKIVRDLQKLDGLAHKVLVDDGGSLRYKDGGQEVENPIENKTIFMHPMPADAHGTRPDNTSTGRDSRPAAGLSEYFPGLGLYLVEVYDTNTGDPVPESILGGLGRYVLGRRCSSSNIHKITREMVESTPRAGILPKLFKTLAENDLPQYYLDANIRSQTPSAKKYVSDFEIFRGKNSKEIQTIMSKNCSVMDEDEYNTVMFHYAAGVATKRIALFDLKKVCKLLSPPGTVRFELFDIGCKDLYPNPPAAYFSVQTATWPPYKCSDHHVDDDNTGSSRTIHTYSGNPNSTPSSPVADRRTKPFGPFLLHNHDTRLRGSLLQQGVQHASPRRDARDGSPPRGELAAYRLQRPSSQSPPRRGGKPHKTRQGKRNKSRNFRNKSRSKTRSRRTRRRVIKRKNK